MEILGFDRRGAGENQWTRNLKEIPVFASPTASSLSLSVPTLEHGPSFLDGSGFGVKVPLRREDVSPRGAYRTGLGLRNGELATWVYQTCGSTY